MARRTKEDAIATRNSLIDAAEQVFGDKGVSRASLSDIAQAAGATRGAIYWHFKDKVDLFNAMMDRVTLPLEQGYGEFESSTCPEPVQRLRAVMAMVLRGVAFDERTRRVFEVALYKVEYVSEMVGVRERHIAASEGFTRQLARDFELAAQMQGVALPMTPMEAAVGLHALFDGLIRNWILSQGGFDLVGVGRVSTDAFLVGLGLSLPQGRCDAQDASA
ncbi:TetR family transcriptional regulator [Acidovorax sp. Leaf76]|jgi:TetR/AcrR family transcriptional regulator, acrAB operon repressor|uniref:TetR family transcriptional regulator n=1 Tax=unclassified Acidovorax TaxID=2684926 RepID=UPI0006F97795|nr:MULTISPECIES: TetR family transcriptional regulator [unclassified Acidovorax]KQO20804.1 TetR family transcriptional regulator [Acidovorax sp. Leaf76]KQO34068.1 TetR family transcriptional regulator [Acidovorax sp. Leaf84]KQS36687.1 TetR family transcriptional regulator [Acidovorax sp. Leaf191]